MLHYRSISQITCGGEEQVEEKGVLIAEEEEKEDSRYVLEAVQEDPAPNDWSNWNTKTYSIE